VVATFLVLLVDLAT